MLKIYDTLTRKKREFRPLKGKQVGFYHCGPTVYWTQHIGNMRAMVLADLVNRSLDYLGYNVKMVRNYTDVGHLTSDEDEGEDKIAKASRRDKLSPEQVAKKYIKIFNDDLRDLNVIVPWKRPKATDHIKEMAKMVQTLIDKGYAYATDLAIYFDISKFENYTALNRQKLSENKSEAGKAEVGDKGKKNSQDFALWFFKAGAHKNALQIWPVKFRGIEQPVDDGFPGWHIECSAMSQKYLGDTLDIHMGGVEHIPVHHTNEIAQSEAATGKKFVNYWLHNEHLTVDGGKMAKSEGTSYTLTDIKDRGYDPLVLRYFFMQAHYRSKQNFTWEALDGAKVALESLKNTLFEIKEKGRVDKKLKQKFISALEDDFNIPQALAVVYEVLKSKISNEDKKATILDFDQVLGLNLNKAEETEIPVEVQELSDQRQKAREQKDFKQSDKLRDEISKLGFVVEDIAGGYKLKRKI